MWCFNDWFETVHAGPEAQLANWGEHVCLPAMGDCFRQRNTTPVVGRMAVPEEVEARRFKRGHGTQPETTRRQLYQDLLTKENREDMAFNPPAATPHRTPFSPLAPRNLASSIMSPQQPRQLPRDWLPAPREKPQGALRRNPMRTAKHKGIS